MDEPSWVDERDVIAIHELLLALEGGPPGLRSQAPLQSALARPRQLYAYGRGPDIIEMAVCYIAGLLRNHPFVDGNKRTAFVVGVLFLEMNGSSFTATEADATQAVLQLAVGKLKEAEFCAWMRANVRKAR